MYFMIPLPKEMTTPRLPVLAYIRSNVFTTGRVENWVASERAIWELVNSFATIKNAVADKLTVTKLNFLLAIAKVIEPFLKFFQSNKPLMPLVPAHLERMLHNLFRMCLPNPKFSLRRHFTDR